MCWQFSLTGATDLVKEFQRHADKNGNFYQYFYDLVEGTLPYSGRDPHCD
jgi:hypothetical protein